MTDKSSILLLGRNTVIFGAIVIFVLSMGIGYFLGYKGSGFGKADKQDLEHGLPLPTVPSPEDKKIIEPSPGNAPVLQDAPKPQATAPAAAEKKPSEPPSDKKDPKEQAEKRAAEKPAAAAKGKADVIEPPKTAKDDEDEDVAPEKPAHAKQSASSKAKAAKQQAPANAGANTKAKKGAVAGKAYTVQLGAFPGKEGALQLQSSLKGKGISTYLVSKTKNDPYYRVRTGSFKNRKEAERGSKAIEKKTGLQNFVTLK